ncbi:MULTISPECIES: hypothetical protein [unclassified Brevibacterium]|jgi:hypothetical protein|uniref:hypothetical protein n=1 Tax=unclassified Brevibacterium TaxID=2614124 RepID=UPI0008A1323D|nr:MULTISPECIES: hypothetical protein [unclassified Brevibacterium]OFL67444.1 hypothetical protein HMPREF2757_10470 [Brevibacterium sp. HMSC063G07]OFS27355.1 hypothetical protein HMPREF3162_02190 [Brevibacterium sp. HMSC07C04]
MCTTPSTPDRLYSVRELQELGYGSKNTIRRRIAEGVVPALMVANTVKIRETDLKYLAVPINADQATA